MKLRLVLFTIFSFLSIGYGFEQKPWFSYPYEFHFRPHFLWGYFSDVENGFNPEDFSSNVYDLNLNLGVTTLSDVEIQLETNFFHAKQLSFNFQSAAAQIRYQLMDDISGDPVSVALGGNVRFVPRFRLKGVSMPYHYIWNFEFVGSVGKEISSGPFWVFRTYGFGAVGAANRGLPWLKLDGYLKGLFYGRHELEVGAQSYFGFGNKTRVDIRRFSGYHDIRHQSIDLLAAYAYHFRIYGILKLEGIYRPFAKAYPEHFRAIKISYDLPFSIF